MLKFVFFVVTAISCQSCAKKTLSSTGKKINATEMKNTDTLLESILSAHQPLRDILARKDELGLQVIYTTIDRRKKPNKIDFEDHYYNIIPDRYFYPASTVKFPVAILALQKLRELNVPGLNKYSTMITGKSSDE